MSIAPEQTWQEAIGQMFTARREDLGLRIHDVAFKVGVAGVPVTSDVVGRIMRGESKNPSPVHLGAIAVVLGIDQGEWMDVAMANIGRPDGDRTPSTCTDHMAPDLGLLAA